MDDVVPPRDDRLTHAAFSAAGADVRYTEFPYANHNAWDPAYATPELWTWLFAQHH
jgi:predicted peptidase